MNKLFLLILLALPIGFMACKTTPQVVAFKTEGVIITTVDSALKAYADYSQTHPVSKDEYAKVQDYYQRYKDAQDIAKLAIEVYIDESSAGNVVALQTAEQNAATASAAVIDLVKGLLK